jgi:hypothetical protein
MSSKVKTVTAKKSRFRMSSKTKRNQSKKENHKKAKEFNSVRTDRLKPAASALTN